MTINENNVKVVKLFPARSADCYLLQCCDDGDWDNLFSDKCRAVLSSLGCNVIEPPELRALRTILLHDVDDGVYQRDVGELAEDISKGNDV